jgi:hypothetical protein
MNKMFELITPATDLDDYPVYIVGQIRAIADPIEGWETPSEIWEFVGVFGSKEQAENACRDYTYFVMGPMGIGRAFPHETMSLDTVPAWYPITRKPSDPLLPGESKWSVEPITANT